MLKSRVFWGEKPYRFMFQDQEWETVRTNYNATEPNDLSPRP